MNPDLKQLQPYPFEYLHKLLAGITPQTEQAATRLSIGEPRHAPPQIALDALRDNLAGLSQYPATRGGESLREAIAEWLTQRFALQNNPAAADKHILTVNGTREALFAFAQCALDRSDRRGTVLMPNPFYQIYEGAALLAGLQPQFYDTGADNDYQPGFDAITPAQWRQCQMIYICTPANPTGSVLDEATLSRLIERAHEYDFIIASDECYSEIYRDEATPPPGLLQASAALGNHDFSRCAVFHSLSKRSNLPGLRSGFVAGDAKIIDAFLHYRTYHGCAMSPLVQAASEAAWRDESHVRENRARYRAKFDDARQILAEVNNLPLRIPAAGFYLWPKLPVDDETFTRDLYRQHNVTVLPGRYLAREHNGINPGAGHVRIALVAEKEDCSAALHSIRELLNTY